jgi:hypothetical protein
MNLMFVGWVSGCLERLAEGYFWSSFINYLAELVSEHNELHLTLHGEENSIKRRMKAINSLIN